MRRVLETNVWIGGLDDARDYKELDAKDIRATLCVIDDADGPIHPGISYFKVGLGDPEKDCAPTNAIFEAVEVLGIVSRLAARRVGSCLVFCADGDNRAALVAAIWLTWETQMLLKDAVRVTMVKDNKPWMKAFGLNWEEEKGK